MRVLALGATGTYAGLVVPALAGRGVDVRAFVHDEAKAGTAREAGADEIVTGDLRDVASLRAALRGVDGLYLILPAFAEDTAELGASVVRCAAEAGARRIVFSGVYHPSLSLVNHAATRPVEEAVYRSELEFTILQPAMYLQGLDAAWPAARDEGAFVMPYSARARMTFVDFRDVADVAAAAFAADDLVGGTFELASPGTTTREEIARLMSRRAGRDVTAGDLDPAEAVADLPAGFERDGLTAMFADYTAHGFHGGNSLVLSTILGRPARTVADYIAQLPVNGPGPSTGAG